MLARQFRDCDPIAGRWPVVIACEVRARRIIQPADDESSVRRKRLRLSASAWLALPRNRGFHQVRFDRIDVYLSPGGELVGSSTTPMPSERSSMPNKLRGDEAELFCRYVDWLVRVTRLRLQCSDTLAEDAAAHAWLQAVPQPARAHFPAGSGS